MAWRGGRWFLTFGVRPARSLLIYLAAVFLGGALLAPALHAMVTWGGGHWPALQSLAEKPFHRYVSRSILVIAVAGLWPLLRALGVRTWRDAGLGSPSGAGGDREGKCVDQIGQGIKIPLARGQST